MRRIERLTTAVRDFRRVSSSAAFASRWLGAGGESLEGGQYDVLDRLGERDAWRMGELATALRVDPAVVTRTVGPLERAGFVERTRDPNDRRAVLVRVTEAGKARHARARAAGLGLWEEALGEFGDEELEGFAVLMRRLTGAFERLLFDDVTEGSDPGISVSRETPRRDDGSAGLADVLRRLAAIEARLSAGPDGSHDEG